MSNRRHKNQNEITGKLHTKNKQNTFNEFVATKDKKKKKRVKG
ncbi:replication protein, partial [Bacillus thuringiensis]|nr:replication protein [Bacillus thuringiensis]